MLGGTCVSAAVQFKVKMVTADDDSVTDIVVEGDKEEIERLAKVGTGCFDLHGLGSGPMLRDQFGGIASSAMLHTVVEHTVCACDECLSMLWQHGTVSVALLLTVSHTLVVLHGTDASTAVTAPAVTLHLLWLHV